MTPTTEPTSDRFWATEPPRRPFRGTTPATPKPRPEHRPSFADCLVKIEEVERADVDTQPDYWDASPEEM